MAAELKIITGANLFCDEDPGESNHLQLDEVGLPDLNRMMEEHNPGGGFMALEIDMGQYEALTLPFKLTGVNANMLARAGYGDGLLHSYTIFKEITDIATQAKSRLTCVVKGMIGTVSQDAYNKQGLSGFDYEIKGVQAYRLEIGDRSIYDFDFFANRRMVNGVDQNNRTNAILGIV